jgi:NAD(P)-dependent dehydrogenase (short-subunit alcohol dehydrogenase family)
MRLTWANSDMQFGKSKGITVNSVAPGPVPTDINAEYFDDVAPQVVPMTKAADRPGTTEDIADIVLFLASEKSRWVTGQFISASGGVTIT